MRKYLIPILCLISLGSYPLTTFAFPNDAPTTLLTSSQPAQALNYEVIALKHRTAFELGELFGTIKISKHNRPHEKLLKYQDSISFRPAGITYIMATENNTLLVEGDTQSIEELKATIKLLDIPTKMVECQVEVVRLVRKGKQTQENSFSASARGLEWSDMEIIETLGGSPEKQQKLQVDLTIFPLGDGSYEIESSWDVSVPFAGKKQDLQRFEKNFHAKYRLVAGEKTVVSRVVQKNGKEEIEIQCCLTVKPIAK
jgi:hypothetical protein